jgi:hypothetical protein
MATVNTVLGPVDAGQIGGTMSHVHLTIIDPCIAEGTEGLFIHEV